VQKILENKYTKKFEKNENPDQPDNFKCKPLKSYKLEYQEVKAFKQGLEELIWVQRKHDSVHFAAKKIMTFYGLSASNGDLKKLCKLKHENIVNCVDVFYSEGKDEMVVIYEYSEHGDLTFHKGFWTQKNKNVPEKYFLCLII